MSNLQGILLEQFRKSMFNTSAKYYFEPLVQQVFPKYSLIDVKATIVKIIIEKADVFTYVLKPGNKWKGFSAGQFIEITLEINGVRLNRIFSISSSEQMYLEKGLIAISVKVQPGGKVTPWMFENLEVGSNIIISQAMGEFVLDDNRKKVFFVAGGSGITPIKSILEKIAFHGLINATLIYYCQSGNHLFEDELKALSKAHENIEVNFICTDKEGRIGQDQLHAFYENKGFDEVFICGPQGLIATTKQLLYEQFNYKGQIKEEQFYPTTTNLLDIAEAQPGKLLLKRRNNKSISTNGVEPILTVLEINNETVRSGCRMGICHRCQCEKESGVVYNTKTKMLSDTGKEAIQICVSIPKGDVVLNI